MARYTVERKDGMYACFDDTAVAYITKFMPPVDFARWQLVEFQRNYNEMRYALRMPYAEAERRIAEHEEQLQHMHEMFATQTSFHYDLTDEDTRARLGIKDDK